VNKKILLIGGAGFIGHHLAIALNRSGFETIIVDSLAVNNYLPTLLIDNENRKLYKKMLDERLELLQTNDIPIYLCDARNYHELSSIINKKVKPDIVIHLAAVAHANRSNKDPYSTFDHSLRTLENALDSCRDRVERFIYFSSSMVYGEFKGDEVIEESDTNPKDIYGSLKLSGELMVKAYHNIFGLPYTIVRPSALYGERCISRRVIQVFIENALREEPIEVRGGEDKLDFTYIDDLVDGLLRVIEYFNNSCNQTFNLTYGEGRSINDVVDILGKELVVNAFYKDRDKNIPKRGTLNINWARCKLGYNPQYPIEIGVRKYLNWYRTIIGKE